MDAEALRQAVSHGGLAALSVGLAVGFAFSLGPVALAAIPVSLAYVTKARSPGQATLFAALFVLGMICTHVSLGIAASLGGGWVHYLLGRAWGLALGPLLIVMGFVWLGWLRVPLPALSARAKRATGAGSAFALGIPFSVAVCPVCTPALIVLLGVALGIGSPLFGGTLLLAFALGRAISIVLGALAIGWLESLSRLQRLRKAIEATVGVLLLLAGFYMLNAYFMVVPSPAA